MVQYVYNLVQYVYNMVQYVYSMIHSVYNSDLICRWAGPWVLSHVFFSKGIGVINLDKWNFLLGKFTHQQLRHKGWTQLFTQYIHTFIIFVYSIVLMLFTT